MNICVDLSRALNEHAGIARYTRSVVAEMIKQSTDDQFQLFATYMRGDLKKQTIGKLITSQPIKVFRIPGQIKEWLWGTQISLPDFWYPKTDVLFAPSFFELPLGTRKKSVLVIYDMTTALFPNQRGREVSERLTTRAIAAAKKADAIITISRQTKTDLVKIGKINPKKVYPIHLATDPIFKPLKIKKEPIILAVGTLEPRKNFARVIEAYAKLPSDLLKKYKLVVVGGLGWQFDYIFEALKQSGVKDSVKFVGKVSDQELVRWYNKASLFVYPSLYEGFGLPPLEAMACGTPVVTSNVSSLPEVVGAAAIKIDPMSVDQLVKAMAKVLTKPDLAKKMSVAGLKQAKKFSWAKNAKQTLEIIHNV